MLCPARLFSNVDAYCGETHHMLLFDAGPEAAVFLRNCENLGVTLDDVEEVAISHGHWDHMGALLGVMKKITAGGRRVK